MLFNFVKISLFQLIAIDSTESLEHNHIQLHWRSQKFWLGVPKWKIVVPLFWWRFSVA